MRLRNKRGYSYALIAVAYTAWWALLFASRDTRTFFVGAALSRGGYLYLLPGDALAIVFAILEAVRIIRYNRDTSWRGSIVTLTTLLGTAIALYLAWKVPSTVWGLYLMLPAATLVVSLEIAGREINIVWGPFRFARNTNTDRANLTLAVARQIVTMWGIFLVIGPVILARVEQEMRWTTGQFHFPGQGWFGVALVLGFGTIGIAAARAMIHDGEGTPLPVAGTQRLVTSGPYAYCRNPMAVAGILQGTAVGVALGSGLVVMYAFCGAILWDLCVRPLEERYLQSEFGAEYAAYRNAVPCWRVRTHAYHSTAYPMSND